MKRELNVSFLYSVMFCPFFKDAEALLNLTIKFFLNQNQQVFLFHKITFTYISAEILWQTNFTGSKHVETAFPFSQKQNRASH